MSYSPSLPPADPNRIGQYVYDELQKIAAALKAGEFEKINLSQLNVAPTKPRDGDIVRADGTNWNPGAGAGFYGRDASTWSKL